MMVGYWPTPMAQQQNPVVAERMNAIPKVVFSRTMERAAWSNTSVVRGDLAASVRGLKEEDGPDMTLLGSGSIVAQLAPEGLIDEYQVVVNPVVLGEGRTMFDGIAGSIRLTLTRSRTFHRGRVFLCYEAKA